MLQVDYSIIASQAGATLNNLMSHAQELVAKLRSLQFDQREFVCLKFLVLFSLGKESFLILHTAKCYYMMPVSECLEVNACFCSTKVMPFFSNHEIFKREYIFMYILLHDS